MTKKIFKADADFEHDPKYRKLIDGLRQIEEEKLSQTFDSRLAKELKYTKPIVPIMIRIKLNISEFIDWLLTPRYRLVVVASGIVGIIIVGYFLLETNIHRQTYWEGVFKELSQQRVNSFSIHNNIPKDIDKFLLNDKYKKNVNDLSKNKYLFSIDTDEIKKFSINQSPKKSLK